MKDIFIDDLREEFVSDYVFPMFRCFAAEGLPIHLYSPCFAGCVAGFCFSHVRLQGFVHGVLHTLPCFE